jgi:hypothetical protein
MMRDEGFDVTGRCRSHSGNIVGNALTSWATANFSRRVLNRGVSQLSSYRGNSLTRNPHYSRMKLQNRVEQALSDISTLCYIV